MLNDVFLYYKTAQYIEKPGYFPNKSIYVVISYIFKIYYYTTLFVVRYDYFTNGLDYLQGSRCLQKTKSSSTPPPTLLTTWPVSIIQLSN